MLLKKVIVKTTTYGTDLVSAILLSNGCSGTTIVDKFDILNYVRNEKEVAELTKFYPKEALVVGVIEDENASPYITKIRDLLKPLKEDKRYGAVSVRIETVNSDHWADIWQDYHKPYTIGKIRIFGTWQKSSFNPFKTNIYLNPGAAFGTGQHPSTEIVIREMQKLNLKNKTIVDVGAGSGILGIVALKLGAKHAYLIDIDDISIDACHLNSKTNGVEEKVTILNTDLVYTKNTEIKGDVLFVNISSQINLDYAKNISLNTESDGYVILSGILPEYTEKTIEAYQKHGFSLINKLSLNNIFGLLLLKKN